MQKRSTFSWLLAIVFVWMLVGLAGGSVVGSLAGYYAATQRAAVVTRSVSGELTAARTSARSPTAGNLAVTDDSAITRVAARAAPAVVTIVNTLQARSGRLNNSGVAEGSGVIIDDQGHIITNAHVVTSAQDLTVIYNDGTQVSARLIGANTAEDIALLQVSGRVPAFLALGDSDALQLGETLIAIGSPLGAYRGSVTVGVVSGLNRSVAGTGQNKLIQTDAAINNGNSGGPLLNLAGEVIGMNTLAVHHTDSGAVVEGLGFAIPSNTIGTVTKQLMLQAQ